MRAPHTGHDHPAGMSSKPVPGSTPPSGSPSAGSWTYPHSSQIQSVPSSATAGTEEQLLERIQSGKLIEGPEYATERYVEGLKRTLVVSGDTELISAPAYMRAARDATH